MSTNTTSNTFTITDAKYLASKIATDLYQMQRMYNRPTNAEIDDYVEEVVTLLKDGYLSSVDYGFSKDNKWVLALSYEVSASNGIDNSPGRIPVGIDISGAHWWSYLRRSSKYSNLSDSDKQKVNDSISIKRSSFADPLSGLSLNKDKSYSSGNVEVSRKTIK